MSTAPSTDDALTMAAVALVDIGTEIRRRAHEQADFPELPNGALETLRVIEPNRGIGVAGIADILGRQVSNVSTQLRELVARDVVRRDRGEEDRRQVALFPHRCTRLVTHASVTDA